MKQEIKVKTNLKAKENFIECKKDDILSPSSYQILHFPMAIKHSKNSKSYVFLLRVFTKDKDSYD